MKVVSWNMGIAYGPYREWHDRAWHWLASMDPDVALIQECVPPDWARDHWTVHTLPFDHWASAIAVKREHQLRPIEPDPDSLLGRLGSYLATGHVRVRHESLLVASVHARAAVAPEWVTAGFDRSAIARASVGEPWSNDVAFAAYRELARDRRFLIGGDWNTARYVDDKGQPKPDGAEFFERTAVAGWTELSLLANNLEGRTWFGSAALRPYQPDHVFADERTAYRNRARVIDTYPVETLGLSDHAPWVLEFWELAPTPLPSDAHLNLDFDAVTDDDPIEVEA